MLKLLGLFVALMILIEGELRIVRADAKEAEPVHGGKSLSSWITALGDADAKNRLRAVMALGEIPFKESPAIPALIERFKDEDQAVCRAAAAALGRKQYAVPALCHALGDKEARVRRWGAFALRKMRHISVNLADLLGMYPRIRSQALAALPTLIKALEDQNADIRVEVMAALGGIGPAAKAAVPRITTLLKDHNQLVQRMAAASLWWIDRQAVVAVPVLVEGMQDPKMDLVERVGWVYVLADMGPKARAAVPALITALAGVRKSSRTKSSVELSSVATYALGRIGEPAVPALITVLRDPDADVRMSATFALSKIGPKAKAAVHALCELAKDGNDGVRQFAVAALGRIGPAAREAVPVLMARLTDPVGRIRFHAAGSLGAIGASAKEAVPALIGRLKDKEKDTRELATWALGRIGPAARTAVPALTEALKTDHEHGLAAEALGRIGVEAKGAAPALVTMLEESHGQAKIRAALAHWRITGQEAKALAALKAVLRDGSAADREDAAEALGVMGPQARAAVPNLIAVMHKKGLSFPQRRAAYRALKKIDPKAAYQALKEIDPKAAARAKPE
jgi:HEAT repeat protein